MSASSRITMVLDVATLLEEASVFDIVQRIQKKLPHGVRVTAVSLRDALVTSDSVERLRRTTDHLLRRLEQDVAHTAILSGDGQAERRLIEAAEAWAQASPEDAPAALEALRVAVEAWRAVDVLR